MTANGSLQGTVAVITGATGNVGWGAAQAFAAAGAHVVAAVRGGRGADEVRRLLADERHLVVSADLAHEGGAETLRDAALSRFGRVDHVVAVLGPWWQKGPVVAQAPAEFRDVMGTFLESHFLLARAFLPVMRAHPGTSYTLVTGAVGEGVVPGAGLLVVAVMGQFGLSRVLRAEHRDDAVRINELRIRARIEKAPRPGVIPSREAGRVFTALEDWAFLDVASHLARRLLELCDTPALATAEDDGATAVRLPQEELARLLGATRESVGKVLKGWERQGLVSLGYGRVVIRSREGLAAMVEAALGTAG